MEAADVIAAQVLGGNSCSSPINVPYSQWSSLPCHSPWALMEPVGADLEPIRRISSSPDQEEIPFSLLLSAQDLTGATQRAELISFAAMLVLEVPASSVCSALMKLSLASC